VPPRGITLHHYHPDDPRTLATIRLSYPRIAAIAGPCGLWPEDLGPSLEDKSYSQNREYYNFGCAYQRNMAAMVDNPSDLVQPRPETPAYTARRTEGFDKYRKGESSTTSYPEADKAKLSDTGK
jgi:pilus assembly protein CpaD